ncbi:MAG: hypothetical protein SFY68_13750 [Candidatus Sumerlaeia bacterium]|nr:hypothetical protein [Candidatus Sumerlaeia bacterium]
MPDDTQRTKPSQGTSPTGTAPGSQKPTGSSSLPFDMRAGQTAEEIIQSALSEIDSEPSAANRDEHLRIVSERDYSPSRDIVPRLNSYEEASDSTIRTNSRSTQQRPPQNTSDSTAQRVAKGDPARAKNNKYRELCQKNTIQKLDSEDLAIMEELSDVVAPVNKAVALLDDFIRRYPQWINDEKFMAYRNSLRDTATIMLSEFYSLRNGKKEKTYSEEKICKGCHSVFMFALPDGLCDECRGRKTHRNAYESLDK